MIHDIREAFNELLEHNEWMDDETRAVAKDTANSMNERIGYPEYITNRTRLEDDYSKVRTLRGGSTDFEPEMQLICLELCRFHKIRNCEIVCLLPVGEISNCETGKQFLLRF